MDQRLINRQQALMQRKQKQVAHVDPCWKAPREFLPEFTGKNLQIVECGGVLYGFIPEDGLLFDFRAMSQRITLEEGAQLMQGSCELHTLKMKEKRNDRS